MKRVVKTNRSISFQGNLKSVFTQVPSVSLAEHGNSSIGIIHQWEALNQEVKTFTQEIIKIILHSINALIFLYFEIHPEL